jgi:hypothetical protein
MQFSMTGQEKRDLLIQVTAWAGLTVQWNLSNPKEQQKKLILCMLITTDDFSGMSIIKNKYLFP